jgi:hypothetical protein
LLWHLRRHALYVAALERLFLQRSNVEPQIFSLPFRPGSRLHLSRPVGEHPLPSAKLRHLVVAYVVGGEQNLVLGVVWMLPRNLLMMSMLLLLLLTSKLVKRTEVLRSIVLRVLDVRAVTAFFGVALGL